MYFLYQNKKTHVSDRKDMGLENFSTTDLHMLQIKYCDIPCKRR